MKELLLAFMLMASQLSGLPPAKDLPTMAFLPADQMCKAVEMCGTDAMVKGHYDMATRRLTLPMKWNPSILYDLGSLLHEMVHHLQAEEWPEEKNRPCKGKIEEQAYAAEHKFFKVMNMAPDIDTLSLLFLTMCDD